MRSSLATDDVDVAVAYPNVGGQTSPVVLRRAVVKHGRYASSSQHELCSKTLLKAQGAPWHSRCGGDDCPPNTLHPIQAFLARKLRLMQTNRTRCQESNMADRQHSYGESRDRQPENRFQ
jgi:hypothetical protein